MRLIVASTRVQQQNLQRQHPDDLVKCVGDALYGYRVSEIVDETIPEHELTRFNPRVEQWWERARCRVIHEGGTDE